MANFDVYIRQSQTPFLVVLSNPPSQPAASFSPPTVNQIYPRSDYSVGSSYGITVGQLWPRGTGRNA